MLFSLLRAIALISASATPNIELAQAQHDYIDRINTVEIKIGYAVSTPDHIVETLSLLGSNSYREREEFEGFVAEHLDLYVEVLAWGLHSRDPEIRLRSARLLNQLFICGSCGGSGRMIVHVITNIDSEAWPQSEESFTNCTRCFGTGIVYDVTIKK